MNPDDAPGSHLPFGARQVSHDVSAGVDGVGEHLVNGGVARLDPSDLAALMHPQREFEPLRAEPQPHPPGRAGLGEMDKDLANGGADGFIRMKTNLAVLLPQTKPTGRPRRSSPRAALLRMPPLRRARNMCNSASLIVPFNPSASLSLNTAG